MQVAKMAKVMVTNMAKNGQSWNWDDPYVWCGQVWHYECLVEYLVWNLWEEKLDEAIEVVEPMITPATCPECHQPIK